MKRGKIEGNSSLLRRRLVQFFALIGILYLTLVSLEVPFVFRTMFTENSQSELNGFLSDSVSRRFQLESEENLDDKSAPFRPLHIPFRLSKNWIQSPRRKVVQYKMISGLVFDGNTFNSSSNKDGFLKTQKTAWEAGRKLWDDIQSGQFQVDSRRITENLSESCPSSISMSGFELVGSKRIMVIPCGLIPGSSIALVGKPRVAHPETNPKISLLRDGDQSLMVSQFMIELQGLKTVEGEEPPRILHFNPRLKGDWSENPVIEMNTCYRMQWGTPIRCEGWKSRPEEETVDTQAKCEKWVRNDLEKLEKSTASWWITRLISGPEKADFDWPYPFEEGKHFLLTLSAGLEGYHINVDGRHIASFPYHTGFALEDATGFYVNGDINVHSVFAASLPTSHPIFALQKHLEMSSRWHAPAPPKGSVELFIGVLSSGHHFAERMAARRSWMQHGLIRTSHIVARFFVAMHARMEVNVEVKKEAEFFRDVVFVPYMDNYDLVVLKTVAICEYGVRTVSAKYIMKCDDDTFVRPNVIIKEVGRMSNRSVYFGNINFGHKPLRSGKWAVTYEEWPEEEYPPYANGAGYLLSADIAQFIVSEFERHRLRLFKMEDVSVGMWVEKFNMSKPVEYVHSVKYCQHGCIENYYTAHYQSPRQMICLWDKLQDGIAQCCNVR